MSKFSIIVDFIKFLMQRKKYWLIPIVLVFLLIGVLLVVTKGSVVAPFIYTLF
jgi:competence protein ComGC